MAFPNFFQSLPPRTISSLISLSVPFLLLHRYRCFLQNFEKGARVPNLIKHFSIAFYLSLETFELVQYYNKYAKTLRGNTLQLLVIVQYILRANTNKHHIEMDC